MPRMELAERHVVITGAAGGLGPAVVEAMLAAGAICHLPVRANADRLPRHARILAVEGVDLTDENAVTSFYARCPPLWASIHVAGGYNAALLTETRLADLRGQLDLNLVTAFLCCREAVRNMRAKAAGGRLVNVSARTAAEPAGGSLAYIASKAAVSALVRALADELAEDRILVNGILPGTIDTPANRAAMPYAIHTKWTKPAEIAALIAWLVSPAQTVVSGALVPVGWT
jgi:NAD(P)-dependent dehydrogenase (short-subunit alcohol dehydrogenase family)